MSVRSHSRSREGFALLPVVLLLAVIGAVAFLAAQEGALEADRVGGEHATAQARYVAEAGLEHAIWQANHSACVGYALPVTAFGPHEYQATFTPGTGSPVSILATGTHSNGTQRVLESSNLAVYEAAIVSALQPDAVDGKDGYLKEENTKNFGTSPDLWVENSGGGGADDHSPLQFDVSHIPADAKVLSAVVELYRNYGSTSGGSVSVHRISRDWTEGTKNGFAGTGASWTESQPGTNWTAAGGDFDAVPVATTQIASGTGWNQWEIAALVQSWVSGRQPNQGLMLVGESAGTLVAFSSSDDGSSSGSKRPKLTVTYACECGVGGSSGSAVLQPGSGGEDTFGWDGAHQDTNFGVSSILQLNNASAERFSLLRFDFSGLPPGALVSSASLELYLEGGSALAGGVLDVHRATQPWIEGTQDDQTTTGGASYNVYSLGNPWTSSGGDYDSPPMDSITIPKLTSGFYSWDVTPAVADWVAGSATNDGFFVRASGGNVDKISFTSSDSASTAQHPRLTIAYTCPCGVDCGGGGTGYSSGLILSTDSDATLGGLAFTDIDLAEYDAATDSATLFFEGALTKLDKDIDAVHVLDSGNIVLSTKDAATLGGLSFGDGDLVEYDPSTDTATLFFDGGLFAGAEDVISVHVMDNGHLVLSTDSPAVLGGLSFDDIDLVEYDPVADKATLFFEGALTTLDQDINAVHVLDSGNIVLSTKSPAMLGGIKFLESSLVEYDPSTDSATLYFDGMLFAGSENVISAFVGTGAQDSGPDLLMVVADPLDLTAQEEAKQALIEGWGYSVSLIDDEDTQSAFKEALDATDVAYVSGDVDPGLLGTKLTSTPRGVVNEHYELHDELGFAQQKDTKGFDKIMVVDVTHSITEGFSTGWLTVTTSEQPLEAMDGGVAPGLQTLATVWITGANYQDGLAVLDPGAALYGGGSAAGRRAQLPWGTTGFDIGALNANGLLIMERAIRWAEGAGGGGGGGGDPDPPPGPSGYVETYQTWSATSDNTWQVKDLAALGVPADAVVEVAVQNAKTSRERWGGVRSVGSSLDRRFRLHEAEGEGVDAVVLHVQADANARIEHYAEKKAEISFTLLGYWTGATYVERFDPFSAGGSGSWREHDFGSHGVGANLVAEVVMVNTSTSRERVAGVRPSGASFQRRISIHEAESGGIDAATMQVNVDGSSIAEVYAASDSDIDFYVTGYWSTPPGTYVETGGGHGQASAASTWHAGNLAAYGVPADSVAQILMSNEGDTAEQQMGVRETGSTPHRVLDLQEAESGGGDSATLHVNTDGSSQIEWYSESGASDRYFYVLGWWVLSP